VSEALQSELAHLKTFDGGRPPRWAGCGWRREPSGDGADYYRPVGPRIGYIDEVNAYLIPISHTKSLRTPSVAVLTACR